MSTWKDLLVSPNTPIEQAIGVIDAGTVRIALVVDADGRLIGTVTDGDVRRAILQHVSLAEPTGKIMNPAPRAVQSGTPREDVLALMQAHQLLQVPIVDASLRVVGLETLQEVVARPRLDHSVFLMAGGFGKRLRPLTDDCPKPMLRVGGKPILETILESFIAYGFHEFHISVHYKAETIKNHFGNGEKWNATIRYIEEEEPLGTAGALSLMAEPVKGPVLVMNGDLLTRANFLDLLHFHEAQGASATVCGREYSQQVPFGVIEFDGHKIRRIVEKPRQSFFVNAGIYVVAADVIREMPRGQAIDMPDLLQQLIDRNKRVCFFPVHEYWLDVGQMSDFERASQDYAG